MNIKKTKFTMPIPPYRARTDEMSRIIKRSIEEHFDVDRIGVDVRQLDDCTLEINIAERVK